VKNLVPIYAPGVYHSDKADRRGNNSISKYKAAPCRYLGVNPDSPANYLVYDILRKRIITRSTCKFEENFTKKTIADYEEQLKIADIDEEFLDVHREEWNDIEENLEVKLPDRIQDRDVLDADETPPVNIEEAYDDDDNDQVQYWNEPGEDDGSIIPMYTDWMKDKEGGVGGRH
jgi:hypothetical protein